MTKHILMGGKLHLYKRPGSDFWQCSTYMNGKNRRVSTKEASVLRARELAEDWYLELCGKRRANQLDGKTFKDAADQFLKEYPAIVEGQRNPLYVKGIETTLKVHVLPFFGHRLLSEINAGTIQEFRMQRISTSRTGKPPAKTTRMNDMVVLRGVLKTAHRHGWIAHVPDLSQPYKTYGKVGHRAWFSPEEYKKLYQATRKRARSPLNERWRMESENLHDFVLFMANTGLRPDEAWRLQDRDVAIVYDEESAETILHIEVRGKVGYGYCKSTANAVLPLKRLRERNQPKPTDLLFPKRQRELLNAILREEGLKIDREGNRRTAYSLRHTYICLRLLEGADIYQIAKNCRTSVEMIEKHYAIHMKNMLDASAINRRKDRPARHRHIAKRDKVPAGT